MLTIGFLYASIFTMFRMFKESANQALARGIKAKTSEIFDKALPSNPNVISVGRSIKKDGSRVDTVMLGRRDSKGGIVFREKLVVKVERATRRDGSSSVSYQAYNPQYVATTEKSRNSQIVQEVRLDYSRNGSPKTFSVDDPQTSYETALLTLNTHADNALKFVSRQAQTE